MKTWIHDLISLCIRGMDARQDGPRESSESRNDSLKRLNEIHLRHLCQGWDATRNAQSQTELVKHWTSQQAKYETPLPTISSDSWSRFEDFLNAQLAKMQ